MTTKERIVEEAFKLFLNSNFEKVSISDIEQVNFTAPMLDV